MHDTPGFYARGRGTGVAVRPLMRVSLRILIASVLLAILAAPPAAAATIQDLIKLKAAGLSDDILIALIEADGSVFHLKADDVIAIRKEGLSEKVIMAMIATAVKRTPPVARPGARRRRAASRRRDACRGSARSPPPPRPPTVRSTSRRAAGPVHADQRAAVGHAGHDQCHAEGGAEGRSAARAHLRLERALHDVSLLLRRRSRRPSRSSRWRPRRCTGASAASGGREPGDK